SPAGRPTGSSSRRCWRGGTPAGGSGWRRSWPACARCRPAGWRRASGGRGSRIRVKHNPYSVPARLIGETVEVRVGAEEVEVWYAGALVQAMERLRGRDKHHIDYRHVSGWLV